MKESAGTILVELAEASPGESAKAKNKKNLIMLPSQRFHQADAYASWMRQTSLLSFLGSARF